MAKTVKPAWLFESDMFDEGTDRVIAEVKRQGMRAEVAHYIPLHSGQSYRDIFPAYSCVVFHGTLSFASQLMRETNWIPGAYHNTPSYNCNSYYPFLAKYLLANDYMMLPYGDLLRRKDALYEKYGIDETIFIRPNSGGKVFTGQTVDYRYFDKDIPNLGYHKLNPGEIVVVSHPRIIETEWRFIVADKKVITGSQYSVLGHKDVSPHIDLKASALAEEIAWSGFEPARVWCLDICKTISGNYYLLEIGCVSCAGWYACDPEPIIREVSRVALEEWKAFEYGE